MNKKYSIAKAGLWYTVSNIIIKGIPFFSIPIFVRILSTSDFGLYNTYISYESVLAILIGLGFTGTVKTAKFEFKDDFEKYISSLYLMLSVVILVLIPIFLLINSIYMVEPWINNRILLILLLHSFSTAVFNINGVRFVINGEYKLNILYTLINTLINIVLSLFLCTKVFRDEAYWGRILGTAIAFYILLIVIFINQWRISRFCFCKQFIKYAIRMGIPLIPHLVSVTLLSSCDKIMIQRMCNSSLAGIYSLAVSLVAVLSVLLTSMENAWAPWFYNALDQKEFSHIRKRNNGLIYIFMMFTTGFILVGPELIMFFSTDDYNQSIYALIPLSISVFFNFVYLIPVNLEYFHKKTLYISGATIGCAFINIILNYLFIKNFGYLYAAHATCISKLMLLIFHYFISKKIENEKLFGLKTLAICTATIIFSYFITVTFIDMLLIRWILALLICVVVCFPHLKNASISFGKS